MKVGEIVEATAKSGNKVQRKCVAIIEPKYIEEQKELTKKNGFAPVFVQGEHVWLGMTPAKRSKLSDAEKKARQVAKEKKSAAYKARIDANRRKKIAELEAKLAN